MNRPSLPSSLNYSHIRKTHWLVGSIHWALLAETVRGKSIHLLSLNQLYRLKILFFASIQNANAIVCLLLIVSGIYFSSNTFRPFSIIIFSFFSVEITAGSFNLDHRGLLYSPSLRPFFLNAKTFQWLDGWQQQQIMLFYYFFNKAIFFISIFVLHFPKSAYFRINKMEMPRMFCVLTIAKAIGIAFSHNSDGALFSYRLVNVMLCLLNYNEKKKTQNRTDRGGFRKPHMKLQFTFWCSKY